MAVTLPDAKAFLGLTDSDPRSAQLEGVLQAASGYVEGRVGARGSATTHVVRPDGRHLVLPVAPVVSVTSVTDPSGGVVDLDACDVDLRTGVVTLPSTTRSGLRSSYTVVATAGNSALIDEATLIIVHHLWETRRGRAGREAVFASPEDVVPVGFAIPRRAEQLLSAVATPVVA